MWIDLPWDGPGYQTTERDVPNEPLAAANLISALQHNRALRGLFFIQQLSFVWALTVVWLKYGPGNPLVALIAVAWTFALTPGLVAPVIRLLPPRCCQVRASERVLHHILGVEIFGRLLERSGWNRRNIYPTWGGSITRARLSFRALAARGGGGAHGACFAIHMLLAAAALLTRHRWGAFGILLPGVVVHLYPALLQRAIMLRLQPLLDRYNSWAP
jgi:hypothetical protein